MKTLVDFIIENNSRINFDEWNPDVNYSFEDFCLDNDVNIDDDIIYNEVLKTFNSHHWENYCFGEHQDYKYHQKLFYETLKLCISEEKTKLIHDEEFIYHLTSNNYANKIEKFGLHPKSKSEKIKKIYVLRKNKDFYLHLQGLMGKEKTKTLFKIDVSKLPKDMKFFLDDGATGYDAYYTFEPISPNAIVDKETIENDKFKI